MFYSIVSPIYDYATKLLTFNKVAYSQEHLLNKHSNLIGESVTIVGGGTGNILNILYSINPNISITYIEPSIRMLQLAKKKNRFKRISFLHNGIESISEINTESIILFFIIDILSDEKIKYIVDKSSTCNSIFICDFQISKNKSFKVHLSNSCLKLLSLFFWLFKGSERIKIPNIHSYFHMFHIKAEYHFLNGIINSKVLVHKNA